MVSRRLTIMPLSECIVCFNALVPPVTIVACGHDVCGPCVMNLQQSVDEKRRCPVCRGSIDVITVNVAAREAALVGATDEQVARDLEFMDYYKMWKQTHAANQQRALEEARRERADLERLRDEVQRDRLRMAPPLARRFVTGTITFTFVWRPPDTPHACFFNDSFRRGFDTVSNQSPIVTAISIKEIDAKTSTDMEILLEGVGQRICDRFRRNCVATFPRSYPIYKMSETAIEHACTRPSIDIEQELLGIRYFQHVDLHYVPKSSIVGDILDELYPQLSAAGERIHKSTSGYSISHSLLTRLLSAIREEAGPPTTNLSNVHAILNSQRPMTNGELHRVSVTMEITMLHPSEVRGVWKPSWVRCIRPK